MVAALALFGAGYLVDGSGAGRDTDAVARGVQDGTSPAGVGLSNRERESRRGLQSSGPGGVAPPDRRRGRRGGGADDDGVGGSAETIAGSRRGGSGLGTAVGGRDDETGANGISEDLVAARAGMLPRAGGPSREPPPRHPQNEGRGRAAPDQPRSTTPGARCSRSR
jgi:hypothetical protein